MGSKEILFLTGQKNSGAPPPEREVRGAGGRLGSGGWWGRVGWACGHSSGWAAGQVAGQARWEPCREPADVLSDIASAFASEGGVLRWGREA